MICECDCEIYPHQNLVYMTLDDSLFSSILAQVYQAVIRSCLFGSGLLTTCPNFHLDISNVTFLDLHWAFHDRVGIFRDKKFPK